MMKRVGFSVVIPTFDRGDVVGRAVRSVLEQAGDDVDIELIVVDDGSTDDTRNVLSAIDDERLSVVEQRNAGRCNARNVGATRARHDWLVFLDSDDELLPGALAALAERCEPPCDLVVARSHRVGPNGALRVGDHQWDGSRSLPWGLQAGAFAISRQLFDEIGGYCERIDHSEHTEMAFRLRGLRAPSTVHRTETPTVAIREHDSRYDAALSYATATHLLDHLDTEFREDRQARAAYLGIAGVASARLGRRREALGFLAKSFLTRPRLITLLRSARAVTGR